MIAKGITKEAIIAEIRDFLPSLEIEDLKAIHSACTRYSETKCLPAENEEAAISAMAEHLKTRCEPDVKILPDEYNYSCLPLCLLDAIFSIGVRYTSTQQVVDRYCKAIPVNKKYREPGEPEVEHNISALIESIEKNGHEEFARKVVKNKQLTSSRNGIPKAEAVLKCAIVLKDSGILTIADFQKKVNEDIEKKFREVKGQASGISFSYLKMLCGDANEIKPDRHVLRFLARYLGYEPGIAEAKSLLDKVVERLNNQNEQAITPREVDFLIWDEMAHRLSL